MSVMSSSIRRLSPGTVTGVQHCSLISSWSAVRALCSNSVEAGAKSVAVKVDLSPQAIRIQVSLVGTMSMIGILKLKLLQVIDDGVGMSKEDLAVVGRQHWGSKQTHQAESLKWLRRLSDQVTITSRVRARGSFKVGGGHDRLEKPLQVQIFFDENIAVISKYLLRIQSFQWTNL